MDRITKSILIGDINDACNPDAIRNLKITHIISVQRTYINLSTIHGHENVTYFWIPLGFGQTEDTHFTYNVNVVLDKLHKWDKDGNQILVHCMGGIDRSPFVVALYLYRHACGTHMGKVIFNSTDERLKRTEFLPWDQYTGFQLAYDYVSAHRPQTFQHPDWFNEGSLRDRREG